MQFVTNTTMCGVFAIRAVRFAVNYMLSLFDRCTVSRNGATGLNAERGTLLAGWDSSVIGIGERPFEPYAGFDLAAAPFALSLS